jgi:hypothetical protein
MGSKRFQNQNYTLSTKTNVKGECDLIYLFLTLVVICLFFAFKRKKPVLLSVPFAAIVVYVAVEIILVPGSVFEALKFIFSLR